jgi:hypothetical protein
MARVSAGFLGFDLFTHGILRHQKGRRRPTGCLGSWLHRREDEVARWRRQLPRPNFQTWAVYKVLVSGNECSTCHRMGVATINGIASPVDRGTAREFGPIATGDNGVQSSKNAHSADSPIWMKPNQIFYDAGVEAEAFSMQACAKAFAIGSALPTGCTVTQYGAGNTCGQ